MGLTTLSHTCTRSVIPATPGKLKHSPRYTLQPIICRICRLRYGQHLTKAEVDILSAPHPDSTNLVEDWLSHHDLLHNPEYQLTRSSSGDSISLSVPVDRLEQMLGAKYHIYKHSATETTLIRTTGYSLPSILHDHVTTVTPSTYFNLPKPPHKTSFIESVGAPIANPLVGTANIATEDTNHTLVAVGPTCDGTKITPSCLNTLYNIAYKPVSTTHNSLGVVGYLNQFANHADLQVGGCRSRDFLRFTHSVT